MTFQYTTFQIAELVKCSEDPIYFIENYVTVDTPDGPTLLRLTEAQKRIINDLEKDGSVAELMERATGKTTVALAYIAHQVIFKREKRIVMVAPRMAMAYALMHTLKKIIAGLPEWMQPRFIVNNKGLFELENRMTVIATGPNPNNLRGMTINLLYLDEIEWFDRRERREFLECIIPCLAADRFKKILSLSSGPDW